MAIINTGKASELEFSKQVRLAGGWCHRFPDLATFKGLNKSLRGKIVYPSQLADYLVALPQTGLHLAEIKSVSRKLLSIPSDLLRVNQKAAIAGSHRAGEGAYVIYLHDIPSNKWYIVNPYQDIGKKVEDVVSCNFGESLWKND